MHIRPATLADLDTVCEFNVRLAQESEGKTLAADLVRAGVRALLEDAGKGRYLVAESQGAVVGQLAVTFEWSDWRNGWFWWIQSVYVHADARKSGVFRALFDHLRTQANNEGVIGIRLYVEEDNQIAQATYERLGLAWTNYRVMEICPLTK
jgi:ribosomal protein S18 acetylase RimI-like enzyme